MDSGDARKLGPLFCVEPGATDRPATDIQLECARVPQAMVRREFTGNTTGDLVLPMELAARERFFPRPHERTLADAKHDVEAHLQEGSDCPCCGQFAKMYHRVLNATMALCLIEIVKQWWDTHDWVDVRTIHPPVDVAYPTGEIGKLVHFGLVRGKVNEIDPAKRCLGLWQPTARGVEFVMGRTSVPAAVFLFNNKIKGWDAETVFIQDALGKKFDYSALMAWSRPSEVTP